jgi:hypothetical protein
MINWEALIYVAIAGVVLGAGLPTLYAIGTKMLTPQTTDSGQSVPPSAGRKAVAYLCFAICIVAIIAGVFFLAAGGHS